MYFLWFWMSSCLCTWPVWILFCRCSWGSFLSKLEYQLRCMLMVTVGTMMLLLPAPALLEWMKLLSLWLQTAYCLCTLPV